MRKLLVLLCALPVVLVAGGAGPAQALIIGLHQAGGGFPFGGPVTGYSGSRYQQVYDSSSFSAPMIIDEIAFFHDFPTTTYLYPATYSLYLSTTSVPVNSIDDSANFDANLGADNKLFTTQALSGAVPSTLSFVGTPFTYNPADGNLLLDIQLSAAGLRPYQSASLSSMTDAGGLFSRYHDFGVGFDNYGLVTEFKGTVVPEPATMLLLGSGLVGLAGFSRKKFKK